MPWGAVGGPCVSMDAMEVLLAGSAVGELKERRRYVSQTR